MTATRLSALKLPVLVLVLAFSLSACAHMNEREQRVLSGGAIGAADGAALAVMSGGGALAGALIGGGGGAVVGALLPQHTTAK